MKILVIGHNGNAKLWTEPDGDVSDAANTERFRSIISIIEGVVGRTNWETVKLSVTDVTQPSTVLSNKELDQAYRDIEEWTGRKVMRPALRECARCDKEECICG